MAPGKRDDAEAQNVMVVCRVRPTNRIEINKGTVALTAAKKKFLFKHSCSVGGKTCVKELSRTEVEIDLDDGDHKFNFDQVFGPSSTQEEVYSFSGQHLITDVMNGYNATIFAYGQTGTGKVS